MPTTRGGTPLCYRRLGRAELSAISAIELEPIEAERFLGPLAEILAAVRRGAAHSIVAIESAGALVGFYVVHPDPRDGSCWWLGWLAIDRRAQGCGVGSVTVAAAIDRLRHLPGCRRVRLLVAPDNLRARGLYDRFGFRAVGRFSGTGELVLELAISPGTHAGRLGDATLDIVNVRARRVFRHRRVRSTVGPHAAQAIGVERGPPPTAASDASSHPGGRWVPSQALIQRGFSSLPRRSEDAHEMCQA